MRVLDALAIVTSWRDFLALVERTFPVLDEAGRPVGEPPQEKDDAREAVLDSALRVWRSMDDPGLGDDEQGPFVVPEESRRREAAFVDLYSGFHGLIGRWGWGFFIKGPTLRLPAHRQGREAIFSIEITYLNDAIARLVPHEAFDPTATEPPVFLPCCPSPSRGFAVERETFSVRWDGRVCELGSTKVFYLIERLARRPGHYVEVTDLIEDVWGDLTEMGNVQRTVSYLRRKLNDAGMADLQIDGRQHGHYRLVIPPQRG